MKKKKHKIYFFNKRNTIFLLIVLLLSCIFTAIYYIDLYAFNKRHIDFKEDYGLKVVYTIGDKDKLKDGITIDETIIEHIDDVLFTSNVYVPLTREGDYLVTKLSDFSNKILFKNVTDTVFALNDTEGNVLKDCIYDKKTSTIKIPYKYYENSDSIDPVQVQVESLMTKKEVAATPVN